MLNVCEHVCARVYVVLFISKLTNNTYVNNQKIPTWIRQILNKFTLHNEQVVILGELHSSNGFLNCVWLVQ